MIKRREPSLTGVAGTAAFAGGQSRRSGRSEGHDSGRSALLASSPN
jgi:hypothetical protein